MRTSRLGIGIAVLANLAAAAAAPAQERLRIRPAEVPKEISEFVRKVYPAGMIGQAERREREDRVEFRLKIVLPGRIADAEFEVKAGAAPSGTIVDKPWENDLPQPVADAFKKAIGEASLSGCLHSIKLDADHPDGQAVYEWSLREPRRKVEISPDGATVRIAERIAEGDLPPPVREALAKDYAGARLRNFERIVRNGALSYRLEVRGGDSLVATADGKISPQPK